MAYFNFNKIVPAAPNDPLVNEVTQLNDNWDTLDLKLRPYVNGGTIVDIQQGQEYFDGSFNYAVWNGTAKVTPKNIAASWSAWTTIPALAPRAVRPGFNPKWRNNSVYRMVELSGGFQFDSAANQWTMGSTFTLNADSAGSVPLSMLPVGGKFVTPCAGALTAGTTVVAGGLITIDAGTSFTRIRGQYMGGPGGGNFLMLDQVWWWY